jgi:ubiquitin-protein ligase
MSVRLRRLKADYERLCTFFTQKSRIRIKKTLGDPPEKYQIEYLLTGIEKGLSDNLIHTRNTFLVEITLTGSYPRMAPQCKMLTPVFHPNIAPHAICIGDHWAAGESLANLIVRIAEMISFQSYNLKSPLNGEAAKWTEENGDKIPLDDFDFNALLSVGEAVGRNADGSMIAGTVCANCGKQGAASDMKVCANNHAACSDCILSCPLCGAAVCLKCPLEACAVCQRTACQKCSFKCGSCNRVVCTEHTGACSVCQTSKCQDCLVDCDRCGKPTCIEHIKRGKTADGTRKHICLACVPLIQSGASAGP